MRFAIVFPGQGSQSVGMLTALAETHDCINATFAEASEALGCDLGAIVREGPAEELNRTELTQPALLAAGIAVWRLWQSEGGGGPVALAGHSLGEYTALVAAGALDFADALRLVQARGEFMQAAVPAGTGAMAAIIGLDGAAVDAACAAASALGIVAAANLNAPGQIVISGERAAVKKAGELAGEAGAKRVVPLAVSVPSHSELMSPAADRLAAALVALELRAPTIPVVNNVEVAAPKDPVAIEKALVRQLTQRVRWTETVTALRDDYAADALLEFGPGKVLTGLTRRIDRTLRALAVNEPDGLEAALDAVQ
jgi:[acyl-carrier-protein] S-malonyltransferase